MTELWVGCFTDDDGRDGLVQYALGGPEPVRSASTALRSPAWLVGTDFGAYAIEHLAESGVSAVTAGTAAEGAPSPGPMLPTHGVDACHGALNPSRSVLAVAQYTSGSVAFVPVDGTELAAAVVLPLEGHSGVNPDRQEAPHAHQVTWLDDVHVLVNDLGADLVRVIRFEEGRAEQLGAIATPAGFGPRHLVLRLDAQVPGGAQFAVCGELTGAVVSFRHQGSDWATGWSQVHEVAGSRQVGSQPSGLRAVGRHHLALANRVVNTISILEWTAEGQLSLVDEFDCGGDHPRDLVVHDQQVWVANQNSDNVCAFTTAHEKVQDFAVRAPAALYFR